MLLNVRATCITGAVTAAVFYAGGALLNLALSWGAPALVSYIFHVDLIALSRPFTWDSFLVGLVICAIAGSVIGGVAGTVYNRTAAWLAASSAASAQPAAAHPR